MNGSNNGEKINPICGYIKPICDFDKTNFALWRYGDMCYSRGERSHTNPSNGKRHKSVMYQFVAEFIIVLHREIICLFSGWGCR